MKYNVKKDPTLGHPINEFLEDTYFKGKKEVPPIVGMVLGKGVSLVVNTPEISQEFFLNKNKYYDKHEHSAKTFSRLMGDSIIFAKSDLKWQQKRKSLSAAIYKDKLRVMVDMMKQATIDVIKGRWMKLESNQMDIAREITNIFIEITLCCLFGTGS